MGPIKQELDIIIFTSLKIKLTVLELNLRRHEICSSRKERQSSFERNAETNNTVLNSAHKIISKKPIALFR